MDRCFVGRLRNRGFPEIPQLDGVAFFGIQELGGSPPSNHPTQRTIRHGDTSSHDDDWGSPMKPGDGLRWPADMICSSEKWLKISLLL